MVQGHRRPTFASRLRRMTAVTLFLALFIWAATALGFGGSTNIANGTDDTPRTYAFATVLMGAKDSGAPDVEEPYLQAARLLTFQLLRNPRTRSKIENVPFIILVTPEVPQSHRNILSREGATVIPVENVHHEWDSESPAWKSVIAKLHLWTLEQYDKILFLDVGSILLHPIHDIFDDPATEMRATFSPSANLPTNYMFAAPYDSQMGSNTQVLYSQESHEKNQLDTGFFALHPSKDVHRYYTTQLHALQKQSSARPEQELLDYAHRKNGHMPLKDLGSGWNQRSPNRYDYENGLKSINHEWWHPTEDAFISDRIALAMDEMIAYLNH